MCTARALLAGACIPTDRRAAIWRAEAPALDVREDIMLAVGMASAGACK